MSNLQPTPIVDKNGKQTTVHKRTDSVEPTRSLPGISTSTFIRGEETARDVNLADIDDLVAESVSKRILIERPSTPGIRNFVSDAIDFGQMGNGNHLVVNLSLTYDETLTGRVNDELEPIDDHWRMSIKASVQDNTGHGVGYSGDIKNALDDVRVDGEEHPRAESFRAIWEEYEFDGVRPGTVSQMNHLEALGYDWKTDNIKDAIDKIPDDNGHAFGSKPLVHEISSGNLAYVLDTVELAKSKW